MGKDREKENERTVEEKIAELPARPGVYVMKNSSGEVLYIGKAKNLRSRVRSYFSRTGDGRYAVRFIATRTEDIETIVTANEKEALFLEDTLLKKHKPRYNIRLKDSKTYVSIKITLQDEFPRILVTRQVKRDGARYFGPYVSARDVRETVKFIRRIFPLCVCSKSVFASRTRPCLDHQLGLCSAPAVGLISKEEYRELVDGAVMFLEGRNKELLKVLKKKMEEASRGLEFEKAAEIRDRIAAIEGMLEDQRVVTHRAVDQDVVAFSRDEGWILFQVLFIREGRLVGSRDFGFEDAGLPDGEVLSTFLTQFYRGARHIPDEVVVQHRLEDSPVVEEWLTEKKGKKARLVVPARGDRVKLLGMAEANALEALRRKTAEKKSQRGVLQQLQRRLHLKKTPKVIEAYDISNIGGALAVGARVTFADGEPDKSRYRLYRIKGVEGPDDYAMMYEVLSRRFSRAGDSYVPDLVLMDGGKGQLNVAVEVVKALGIEGVELASLAKDKTDAELRLEEKGALPKGERVYLPGVKDPVFLKEGSKPDLLLRRIRDEVHRFAITYHRKLRSKELGSVLEKVPGIGPKKRKALFERFGDLDGIASASVEEIAEVPGITGELAERVKKAASGASPGG